MCSSGKDFELIFDENIIQYILTELRITETSQESDIKPTDESNQSNNSAKSEQNEDQVDLNEEAERKKKEEERLKKEEEEEERKKAKKNKEKNIITDSEIIKLFYKEFLK